MQKEIRYTLGKDERLKSRKVIDHLFKEGKSFSIYPFRIVWKYQPDATSILRAGFTVSTKHFKKAVDRNRIRRLIKEAYRLQKNTLQQQLQLANKPFALFIIYVGKEVPPYLLVVDKIVLILQRLQKITNENTSANS